MIKKGLFCLLFLLKTSRDSYTIDIIRSHQGLFTPSKNITQTYLCMPAGSNRCIGNHLSRITEFMYAPKPGWHGTWMGI